MARRDNEQAVLGPRPPLRRLLDVWGFVPGFAALHEEVSFETRDGVRLAGTYLPGPVAEGAPAAETPAVVLLHGFAGHHRKPPGAYLAERLASRAAVLAIDLRGHGRSGGECGLGGWEALDARAASAWLRRRGHRWVAGVGLSMGGAALVGAAGGGPSALFDAVCTISAPSQWGLASSPHMRAIGRLVRSDPYRVAAGLFLRIRVAARWGYPPHPLELAAGVAPTPLLVVHGTDDHFFGPQQAFALYERARPPKTLWLEPAGFGHADDGITPEFVDRLGRALVAVRANGVWPEARQRTSAPLRSSVASSAR